MEPRKVTVRFVDGGLHTFNDVPGDITPDQIEARVEGQFPGRKITNIDGGRSFSSTPGGAATGVQTQSTGGHVGGQGLESIAGATTLGAAAGAVTPEILTFAAGLLRQIPQGARVAPLLESAAIASKSAGRVSTTLSGAVSGLASESAGQFAEKLGAGDMTAEVTRFAAGGIGPESLNIAKWALNKVLQAPALSIESKIKKEIAKSIVGKIEGRPQDISQEEADYLNRLVGDLRGGPPSDISQRGIYDLLRTGARSKISVSEEEAKTIISNSGRQAQDEISTALNGPVSYARTAATRISNRGQDALATAQLQRFNIGDDLPVSDIGNGLRSVIVKRNQEALRARTVQYKADEAARDTIVREKEKSGELLQSVPEYNNLLDEIRGKLLIGEKAQSVSAAPVTESGVLRAYQNIYDAISGRKVEIGIGEDGKKVYKTFATSFEALDDVRRKLGDVFRGQAPEGYDGISASIARKYYQQIRDIQVKFAGGESGPQDRLLKAYADSTSGLEMFGSRMGKKITALDRYDDSKFQIDAASLPRQFFQSKQGVQDLLELSGSREPVVKAGLDLATNELNNLNEKQVREWMTKRREMLSVLPEVRDAVSKYANTLQYGERVALSAERGVGRLEAYQQEQIRSAQQRANKIESAGRTEAGDVTSQAGREATTLLGSHGEMFPVQNVKSLISSGSTKQWEHAAPLILASPNGKEMLSDSIRQTLADKALVSTKGLGAFFDNNIKPALTATKLMPESQMNKISSQLEAIENMKVPEPEKLGLARRFILQSFAGYGASAGARGATSLVNLVPNP